MASFVAATERPYATAMWWGHIVFSRLPITAVNRKIAGAALAPTCRAAALATPRRGGRRLVRAGLRHCAKLGIEAVVVLGHPTYYPPFRLLRHLGAATASAFLRAGIHGHRLASRGRRASPQRRPRCVTQGHSAPKIRLGVRPQSTIESPRLSLREPPRCGSKNSSAY